MNMGSMEYMDTLHYISCIFVDISDNHLLFFAMQKNLYSTLGFIGVRYNDQLIKSCCCIYMSDAKRLQPGTQQAIVCLEKKLYSTELTTQVSFSRNFKKKKLNVTFHTKFKIYFHFRGCLHKIWKTLDVFKAVETTMPY